jgi:hypothetical protein
LLLVCAWSSFFGGTIKCNDASELNDMTVAPRRATFPPPKREQTSDDRWFQFHNALRAEPCLSPKEIIQAQTKAAYGITDSEKELLDYLKIHAAHDELELRVPRAPAAARSRGPRL